MGVFLPPRPKRFSLAYNYIVLVQAGSWHKMGSRNIETLLRFGTLGAQSKEMCHKLIGNITRFTSVKTETGVHHHHHHHHLDLTRPPPAPIAPPPF